MLIGLLILHDFIFDSDKEIALRKENFALERSHVTLTAQLGSIRSSLSLLEEKDKALHSKFFGTPLPQGSKKNDGVADQQVLLSNPAMFREALNKIEARTSTLILQSAITNSRYAKKFSGRRPEASFFEAMPSTQPIRPWQVEKIISGFGVRINPFHKGLYEHPGVDIAVPRGTEVIATAPGVVREVNKSNLQAGYGNYVEIDHGAGFITRYAHLETIRVRRGQRVSKQEVIGAVGSSGGSVAPHLHYEVIRNGAAVDPITYMVEGISSDDHFRMTELGGQQNQSLD